MGGRGGGGGDLGNIAGGESSRSGQIHESFFYQNINTHVTNNKKS